MTSFKTEKTTFLNANLSKQIKIISSLLKYIAFHFTQGLPVPTVGTSMAVTITHVFLWGSRATNHTEKALMGSP